MRVLLIDVDSKIPNLALMKISAYHKQKGDQVGFNIRDPDLVYTSIIYKKNEGKGPSQKRFGSAKYLFGGPGVSLDSKLPDEIEFIKPDYDLYPSEFSQGFTSRGCDRNCYFCIVPQKEGPFTPHQHPEKFHDDRFNTIMLMDNNILLNKDWTKTVLNWCIDKGLKVDMTQGYDIRLLDYKIADLILQCRNDIVRFAFDDTRLEDIIREKIQMLRDMGFNLRNNVAFYCYCHDDSMHDDAAYRCSVLKSLGVNADVMFNCDMLKTQRIKALLKWSWRKPLFWSIDYKEYSKLCHT